MGGRFNYLILYVFIIKASLGYELFLSNRLYVYKFDGDVKVGLQDVKDTFETHWEITGLFQLQRIDSTTLAAWISPHGVIHYSPNNGPNSKIMINSDELKAPFKIIAGNGAINYIAVNANDPLWTTNLKRAFAAGIQVQSDKFGSFIQNEGGLNGFCNTEYLVLNKTNHITVRKNIDMNTCLKNPGGIQYLRSNVPRIPCNPDNQKNVAVGNDAFYELRPHDEGGFFMNRGTVKGFTLTHTFNSTGSAQYIKSSLSLSYNREIKRPKPVILDADKLMLTSLEYIMPRKDPTAGRNPVPSYKQIKHVVYLLNMLTDNLESAELNFANPIDSHVAETFRIMGLMDFESLKTLFKEIDIGTSYRQETIRNLFIEIIPRIGTKASVLLTRDLVVNKSVKPTTAVQLLISLPFHIAELSEDLVKDCESLLTLGPDRPDVAQAAVLSYATLIHHTYMAGQMTTDSFEKYVKRYFDLFLNSLEYEQQMLYLEALANLEQGNVVEYLEPIIKADYPQNTDIRFLAIWATMSLAHTRPTKTYETYWPIFESRDTPLQLRVAAFVMLLLSDPSPTRLMSLYEIIKTEPCPHLVNFFKTTVESIKRTTYPCYKHLRELLSFMDIHLPAEFSKKHWRTGNYVFDYKDRSGIGAMFQSLQISDEKTNLPHVAFYKFDTEALGRFTGQVSLYVKARGLGNIIEKTFSDPLKNFDLSKILDSMKFPKVQNTPLHFEFIIQFEGKAVMTYYLNQTTFHNMSTQGNILARLFATITGGTHINMQTIRWPFMNKFYTSTVLGTSADVVIESTVSATLRGNMTNSDGSDYRLVIKNQFDARYSAYSAHLSRSYNPFLNYEHEVKQEQGFLGYIPINHEMQWVMFSKEMTSSFIRPKSTTSGLAMKSQRSIGIYEFLLLAEDIQTTSNVIYQETKTDEAKPLCNYQIPDLGLNVNIDVNYKDVQKPFSNKWSAEKNLGLLSGSSNVHASIIGEIFLQIMSDFHVRTTHLGNSKDVKYLITNDEDSKITLKFVHNDDQPQAPVFEFEFSHFDNVNDPSAKPLHKWIAMLKLKIPIDISEKKTAQMTLRRIKSNGEWRMCLESFSSQLFFTGKYGLFGSTIIFGDVNQSKAQKCPVDKSKFEIVGRYFLDEEKVDNFMKASDDDTHCPKGILKFTPPILRKCKSKYEAITEITNYTFKIKTKNMPNWYVENKKRLEHLYAAVAQTESTPWRDEIEATIVSKPNQELMNVNINGGTVSLVNILSLYDLNKNIKYDSSSEIFEEYGFDRTCSVVSSKIYTYNGEDTIFDLTNKTLLDNSKKPCTILLAADCSSQNTFAIFIQPLQLNNFNQFALRIYMKMKKIYFFPTDKNNIIIDDKKLNISNRSWSEENVIIYKNDEDILTIRNSFGTEKIQFNMENMLRVSTTLNLLSKDCGLCNAQPLKSNVEQYIHCF